MRNRFNINESEKNRIRNLHRSVLLEEKGKVDAVTFDPTTPGPPGLGGDVPGSGGGGIPASTRPGGNSGFKALQDIQVFDDGTGDITGYSCLDDPNNPPTYTKCAAYGSPEYVSYYGTTPPQYPTLQDCNATGPCKGSEPTSGHPCPPTNQNSPFHTNYPEFCYRDGAGQLVHCGSGGYYAGNPDCDCCP